MSKLSLCLIVSDKEPKELLNRCLASVGHFVDEICITITSGEFPDEKNKKELIEVCNEYEAKVSTFKWVNDFSKAREFNFSKATGDYIFWCDVDDVILGSDYLFNVVDKMDEEKIDAGVMDYLYDFDEYGVCVVRHRKTRIIKNNGCVKWVGSIHEDFEEQRELSSYFIKDVQVKHMTDKIRIENAKRRNLEIAEECLSKDKKDPRNLWLIANANLSLGNHREAIEGYNKFLELSSSEIEVITALGRMAGCYFALGDIENSIKCSQKVIERRPWYPDGYLQLGELFIKQGKYRHAKEFLIQGLSKEPAFDEYIVYNPRDYDFNPLTMLAECYFHLGKPEEAKKCLERCIEIYPQKETIKKTISELDREIKNLSKIDEICEKAKKITNKVS